MRSPATSPDLWSVVAPACTAASVGGLAGILGALRQINPELRFEFDFLSVMVGLAGAGGGGYLARGLWRLGRAGDGDVVASGRLRQRLILVLVLMAGAILAGFVVASAGLPVSRRRDMIAGGILALLVIGTVGWIIRALARVFGQPDGPENVG